MEEGSLFLLPFPCLTLLPCCFHIAQIGQFFLECGRMKCMRSSPTTSVRAAERAVSNLPNLCLAKQGSGDGGGEFIQEDKCMAYLCWCCAVFLAEKCCWYTPVIHNKKCQNWASGELLQQLEWPWEEQLSLKSGQGNKCRGFTLHVGQVPSGVCSKVWRSWWKVWSSSKLYCKKRGET